MISAAIYNFYPGLKRIFVSKYSIILEQAWHRLFEGQAQDIPDKVKDEFIHTRVYAAPPRTKFAIVADTPPNTPLCVSSITTQGNFAAVRTQVQPAACWRWT